MEEEVFSLGSLDETPDYVEQENDEQEEQYSEDVSEVYEEQDSEEYSEDEEFDEEGEEVEDEDEVSYTPFLLPLVEEGILWVDPEKEYDDSPEGLNEVFLDNAHHVLEETISQLPEVLQQVFELAQLGEDPMQAFQTLNSFDYESIDLEDVSTQKELTKDYYRDKFPNWSEDKLSKHVQNLEDLDELSGEAVEAQEYFVEKTQAEKEAYIERIQAREEQIRYQQEQEVATYNRIIEEADGFAGLSFTSARQKLEFKKYCFERGEDGLTQYERETKAPEDALTKAFYSFNRYSFDSVERKARTNAYVEQQKVLKRVKDKNAVSGKVSSRQIDKPSKGFVLGDI